MVLYSTYRITLFVVILILLGKSCDAGFLLSKAYVEIRNDIPGGAKLTVHCKSKDNDLGKRDLPQRGTFSFRFRPHFFGVTLFWCNFQWNNGPVRSYDIYVQNRDYRRCKDCYWSIKPEGPCLFNGASRKYDMCDRWSA